MYHLARGSLELAVARLLDVAMQETMVDVVSSIPISQRLTPSRKELGQPNKVVDPGEV